MNKKLSEIIKELEDGKAINKAYIHHNYHDGSLELNIEFVNSNADDILKESGIEEIETCAFWE